MTLPRRRRILIKSHTESRSKRRCSELPGLDNILISNFLTTVYASASRGRDGAALSELPVPTAPPPMLPSNRPVDGRRRVGSVKIDSVAGTITTLPATAVTIKAQPYIQLRVL
ncbi:Hypothetical protein CINCED_3A002333 [Cinara cedri]|uniref:Uncharacterized protein n=1 Tax=Cinara cedri TaxID=506608 RepID=A0A5E4MTH6_9HEMI|nr:Hypothetical protein CINCED_3A002333 [Cinara cedri]